MTGARPDWLGAARAAADELRTILAALPTTAERARETGTTGEGGDRTLEIDAAAEEAVFRRLDALHAGGARFTALSEERGTVGFGGGPEDPLVVIDPLDGSKNAKRGLAHHALSIAVADGATMADVAFAYVYDLGAGEEWVARRGEGALLDGAPMDVAAGERRVGGKLELLGFESADPRWVRLSADALAEVAHRVRAFGSIALTLCQVAAARLDGMASLRGCRAVDAAAAQLIVREAGGVVAFPRFSDPLAAPLDLIPHSPVIAARTPAALRDIARVPSL